MSIPAILSAIEQCCPVLPSHWVLLLAVALIVSSPGFYRIVYFVSTGYGFSIAAMGITSLVLQHSHVHTLALLHCAALVTYGLRLGVYLVVRERSAAYRQELLDTQQRVAGIGLGRKALIWIGVSVLYVAMFSPCMYSMSFLKGGFPVLTATGLSIAAGGLLLETVADIQKSSFKKRNPGDFCNVGLYRLVRCPNYLGEVVFWIGSWVAGVSAYTHWVHWATATFGLVCIVLIMMGSTKRLERKQGERYGDRDAYRQYSTSVPVLFPFVPVYTLKGIRVYIE